jgi:hypothetical protein
VAGERQKIAFERVVGERQNNVFERVVGEGKYSVFEEWWVRDKRRSRNVFGSETSEMLAVKG